MKEAILKAKSWWMNLALREKQAVAILGTFLSLVFIYVGIWSPLNYAAESTRERIMTGQKTLAWMENADKEIKKMETESKGTGETVTPVVLLGILQKQVAQAELEQQLNQLKQINNDSVEMRFQKVEFDKLVQLLSTITKEVNVTIAQMAATGDKTPGLVDAEITLRLQG